MRVYVAGCYSSDNVMGVLGNIRNGLNQSANLFSAGYYVYSPWLDFQFAISLYGDLPAQYYKDNSMAWLEVSDVVYVLPYSENSKGVQAEIERAKELKIPVVHSITELEVIKLQGDIKLNTKLEAK